MWPECNRTPHSKTCNTCLEAEPQSLCWQYIWQSVSKRWYICLYICVYILCVCLSRDNRKTIIILKIANIVLLLFRSTKTVQNETQEYDCQGFSAQTSPKESKESDRYLLLVSE